MQEKLRQVKKRHNQRLGANFFVRSGLNVDGIHVLLQLVGLILAAKRGGRFGYLGSMSRSENGYIRLLFSVNFCSVASAEVLLTETSELVDVSVDT